MWRRWLVGKECVDLIYAAQSDHRTAVEFTVIGNQENLTGIFDDGLGNPDLMIVKVEQGPVSVDA